MEARRGILFLLFLILGTIFFSAGFSRAEGPTVVPATINTPTTWTKENSPYLIKSNVSIQAKLTIEPGTVVKFWSAAYSLYINAEFSARGTKNEKVVFTSIHDDSDGVDSDKDFTTPRPPQSSDWKSIYINPAFKIEFNNAIIDYGKIAFWATSSGAEYKNFTIRNSEIRHAVTGIYMENVEPVIENNLITKNSTGVIFFANSGLERKLALSGNSFSGNGKAVYGFNTNHRGEYCVDAKNNWWNDASGPKDPIGNPSGKGEATNAPDVVYDPWLKKDPNDGPDPVIIIPGIMGSWEVDGKWKIDPIFHTYDNLRDEFLANGYEDGEDEKSGGNFFTFPYEWRDSNVDNAKLLAKKIEDIKTETGRPKVDIVAHSMGGLLAREYIESNHFANDVDQLITVGTPHLGAPKDYIKWEAGEFFDDLIERAGRSIFYLEALENGYTGIFPYIRAKIPSVQELLPVYNYLYDENGGSYTLRDSYWENYPRNEFLEKLNEPEKVERLKNVEFTKIIGETNDSVSTISGYNVVDFGTPGIWDHGYPKYFDIPVLRRQGIIKGKGDGTVSLASSESDNVPAERKLYSTSEHGVLPTDAQKDILEILTGTRPPDDVTKWHVPNLLLLLVHSPIDIRVEDENGDIVGKNAKTGEIFENITGSFYGAERKIICESDPEKICEARPEFITIPNPEGEYKITADGNGDGPYTIEAVKISENPADPNNAKEATVLIKGTAETGKTQEADIEIAGDEVIYNPDKTPPAITISSPAEIDYTNDKILNIVYTVEDSESGIKSDSWQVEKDGQKLDWLEKNIDLSLEHLGSYSLKVIASDIADNSKTELVDFRITTNLEAIRNNLEHYFDLGLVENKVAFKFFRTKLENLGKLFNLLEKAENSNLKPKPKESAVKALKKVINLDIETIIRQLERKSPRWIDERAADLVIEDLNYIKISNN